MRAPRLIDMGGAVVDRVYRLAALPAPGAEAGATAYEARPGGAVNALVAARRSGMRAAYGGAHGTGPAGEAVRAALAAEGIEVLLPPSPDLDSGHCVVLVTPDAERSFVTWFGAEGRLGAGDLAALRPAHGDWVLLSGFTLSHPGCREALGAWVAGLPGDVPVILDPAPVVGRIPPALLRDVLARTDWLSCNRAEACALFGEPAPDWRALPRAAGAVIRAGAEGCALHRPGEAPLAVPGFAVEAVDTNGAGDAHVGAFAAALARGLDAPRAARIANAAAAISVTREGGATAPDLGEIAGFLARRDRGTKEAASTERTVP